MKEGYLIKKLGSIPKGWSEKKMPDFSWFQEGPGLRKWQFKDEGIKVINITNMVNGVLDLSKTTRHISLEEFNSTYTHFECQENDIVIASSGNSYCKHAIVRKQDLPLVMNTSVIRFKPLSSINYNYLNQFLKSQLFKEQIDFMITGGAQPNFGPVHLKKVVLALPPLPEQQKIAKILSTVDAKIDLITQRITQTQNLKKGLMQRLLTKGIGHTEFKESPLGEIPKSWEVVKIEDIADVKGGKRLPKGKSLIEEKTNHPYIRVADMKMGGVDLDKILYVPEDVFLSIERYIINKDDLFISVAGTLGIVGGVPIELDGANLTENADKLTNIKLDKTFLLQVLLSPIIQNAVKREQTNNAQPKLALTKIRTFYVPKPPKDEQTQIANILSTVDSKLDVLQNKKTHYQELKKGLMQQLLTGKVRVTGLIKDVV
ncbi:restriction endonuclease subunit S [Tenacibaculum haliotis]|uniref:restriction endonuclease subunit S n=1 Tax=Tenacibaculum haliotis TaxID=1888914 RepID=UPI0021AF3E77|nr:restriction endonuclease subunit S [Tenacibaculum haliotis]MCT4697698.1 restriction endonuclease subunit S [Tenacibaculum haliotis]